MDTPDNTGRPRPAPEHLPEFAQMETLTDEYFRICGNPESVVRALCGESREPGPTRVCLCGSTRFFEAFQEANFRETLAGRIVLSVGFYGGSIHRQTVGITPEDKIRLDELHMRKIDMADEVLILNVGQYIGESTARELAYARARGKHIRFLEEAPADV